MISLSLFFAYQFTSLRKVAETQPLYFSSHQIAIHSASLLYILHLLPLFFYEQQSGIVRIL